METVPSSNPKTISPIESRSDVQIFWANGVDAAALEDSAWGEVGVGDEDAVVVMFATPVPPKRLLASIEQETEALIQPKTELLDGSEPGQLRLKSRRGPVNATRGRRTGRAGPHRSATTRTAHTHCRR